MAPTVSSTSAFTFKTLLSASRHFQPGEGHSRGLLRDCEIFMNLWITLVSSSNTHPVLPRPGHSWCPRSGPQIAGWMIARWLMSQFFVKSPPNIYFTLCPNFLHHSVTRLSFVLQSHYLGKNLMSLNLNTGVSLAFIHSIFNFTKFPWKLK